MTKNKGNNYDYACHSNCQEKTKPMDRIINYSCLDIPKYNGKRDSSHYRYISIRIIAHGDKSSHAKTQQKKQYK